MSQVVRFMRLDGFGEDAVDLVLCRRLIAAPRPQSSLVRRAPEDWEIVVFYLAPDSRWISPVEGIRQLREGEGIGLYIEVSRDEVHYSLCKKGVYPLPPELDQPLARPAESAKDPRLDSRRLKDRGFERITTDHMKKHWHIGRDEIELMADRAMREDRIHTDYAIIPGKQKQLWARLKG